MLQVKRWKQSIEGKCWDGQKSGNIWASFSHPRCFLCSTHSDFPHLTSFMLWYFISWILIANIIECLSRMRHCAQPITYIFSWCHHVKLVFLSHFLRWENRGSEAMTGWLEDTAQNRWGLCLGPHGTLSPNLTHFLLPKSPPQQPCEVGIVRSVSQ